MTVRNLYSSDLPDVLRIHKEGKFLFPFPDVFDPLYPIKGVVENAGKIIGIGLIKVIGEPIAMLDKSCSSIERVHAIEQLMLSGKMRSLSLGIIDWHAVISKNGNEYFSHFLVKKFGFSKLNEDVLYLRLE